MRNNLAWTVYLSASGFVGNHHKEDARALGRFIGARQDRLVYGGMDAGPMGYLAQGAHETGAHITGVLPEKIDESKRVSPHITEHVYTDTLHKRRFVMNARGDLVVGEPGGWGTGDEFLEGLHWASLDLHEKPHILVNSRGFWSPMAAHIEAAPDYRPGSMLMVDDMREIPAVLADWTPSSRNGHAEQDFPNFEAEIMGTGAHDRSPILVEDPTIANSYKLISALIMKQLSMHRRPVGVLNNGQFDNLMAWMERAYAENMVPQECRPMLIVDSNRDRLDEALAAHVHAEVDLHTKKWGARLENSAQSLPRNHFPYIPPPDSAPGANL